MLQSLTSPVCALTGVEGGQGIPPSPPSCRLGRSVCRMTVSSKDTVSVGKPPRGKDPLCQGEERKSGDTCSVSASEKWNKNLRPVPVISPARSSCKFEWIFYLKKLRLKFLSVYFTGFGFQVQSSPSLPPKNSRQHAVTLQQVGRDMAGHHPQDPALALAQNLQSGLLQHIAGVRIQ